MNISILRKLKRTFKSFVLFKGAIIRGDFSVLKISPNVKGKVYINKQGKFEVGRNLTLIGKPWPIQLTVVEGANLFIGENVLVNAGVGIASNTNIVIEDNVKIGPRTSIFDSQYHPIDSNDVRELGKEVIISKNTWIGAGCIILPGVRIGENSVIAAGSVVNKDVPPNTLVGGVPAAFIKSLNVKEGWIRN
ncbi:acyltransferase [Priestia megaterium]|uniref:acyltransferase n=1 Tax=Priestia megaterium TaxID=1404 RepID=UPI003C2B5AF3